MKKQNKKFTKTKKLNEKDEAIVNRYTNQISRRIKEDQTEIKIYQSKRKRGHSFRFWVLEYIDNEGNTVKQEYKKKSVAYSIKAKLEKMALEGTLREKVYEGSLLSLLYELNDLCVTAPRSSKHAIQPSTHRSYESAIKRYHNFLNIPLTSLTIEYIEDVRSKTSYCVRSFNELINRLVHLRENF